VRVGSASETLGSQPKTRTAPRDGRGTGRDVNPPSRRIAPSIRAAGPSGKTQIYKTASRRQPLQRVQN